MHEKLYIAETPSTNTWLREDCARCERPNLFTIYTFRQTAGRGQAGNAWESEDGKNLSFSTLFHIHTPEQAVRLNMLVPLAVCKTLGEGLFTIKWPNDIYWQDKKVAGLLNENVIVGSRIRYAVAGIGVNVNQEVFRSDAPNPISLKQITGKDYELEPLMDAIVQEMERLLPLLDDFAALKAAYMEHLYRRQDFYPFVERDVSVAPTTIAIQKTATPTSGEKHEPFLAEIADIDDFGRLVLRRQDGTVQTYHFKEIRFVL